MGLLVGYHANYAAFWVFLFAIVTDLVDGWVARLLNATSRAALFLDPLADKILTDAAWIALAIEGMAPVPLVVVVLIRDLAVGAVWAWALPRGVHWAPRPMGQISVAFEGIALCVLLFHGPWLDVHWPSVGSLLGVVGLALSTVPLVEYAVGWDVEVTA